MQMTDDRDERPRSSAARRPRITVGELRERMLDAALAMVADAGGLTVSLAHLNMEEIIRTAGVPRSSVYREWDTKEDFYVELMIALTAPDPAQSAGFDAETMRLANSVISDNTHRLTCEEGRRAVLYEAIRVGAKRNYQALSGSLKYQTITALVAALPAFEHQQRAQITAAMNTTERFFTGRMEMFYKSLLPRVGFRMKPGLTELQLATAGASIIEGMARRNSTTPERVNTPVRYPGIDGEIVDWHLAALTLVGVIEFMLEPIPGWVAANPAQSSPGRR
ncbi:TetR/AcrR family transcriptional regulator [Gordonia sp. TBRC 11910]|uniref:TetR/AcrR family transcriptional regulator n=1 Tax=Gordonia asplenii TaxID=2725283 RepID=A0A848KPB5_9ACTN|nr:TetR/AcrR family transcriptional regulator [Gordonia asplenii]NMO00150.1 TetR/AcrR family transcriptional regulator [Gordonia asplenii]